VGSGASDPVVGPVDARPGGEVVSGIARRSALPGVGLFEPVRGILGRSGFLVLMLATYGVALLVVSARSAPPDTWLGIVAGREIFQHGLPHIDSLTVLGAGREWIDQQWLAHAAFYALYELGGMTLILFANAALGVLAVAAAMRVAARRGASVRATGWIVAAAMVPFLAFAVTPRAQSFVYPLFVVAAALLVADGRRPSKLLLLLLPILLLWANLHGSVVLMALLVTGHALLELRRRRWLPSLVAILAWACVFASPYAADLPSYYRSTLANPAFGSYVTEWQATHLSPATLPFFVLVGALLYLAGRSTTRLSGTEQWLVALTAFAGLVTLRNIVWFALVAMMILPPLLDGALGRGAWSVRFNRLTGLAGLAMLAVAVTAVLNQADAGRFPDDAAAAVARAAGDDGRVYADQLYADWLLAVNEGLAGRVAFDGRFEIFDQKTLDSIIFLRLKAVGLPRFTRTYRVFVLDRAGDAELVSALTRVGFASRYERDDLVVLARPNPPSS
jgi:hypothetical protein